MGVWGLLTSVKSVVCVDILVQEEGVKLDITQHKQEFPARLSPARQVE